MSSTSTPMPHASVMFRTRIIDALNREHFEYVDEDTCAGRCPLCGGVLSVYFHGAAPRADLVCRLGCDEKSVAAALDPSPRRRKAAA